MALTANGLTPCPGGDCHGIDHSWCAPGRHQGPETSKTFWPRVAAFTPRHRKDGPVLDFAQRPSPPLIPYLHN